MSTTSVDENLLLYINISGELFYIVIHRMEVQGIEPHLQFSVAQQLILALTSAEALNDIVQGQLQFTDRPMTVMRTVFKDIVDGTSMKINAFSMEKLFELTLIATKYQYTVCGHPKDILLVALNHLDSLRKQAKDQRAIDQTEYLHHLLVDSFGGKSGPEMEVYRWHILHYLEEIKLKMTNLVNMGLQDENGEFVKQPENYLAHPDDDLDFTAKEGERSSSLQAPDRRRMHSLELDGDRVITLGLSIYNQKTSRNSKPFNNTASGRNSSTDEFGADSVRAVQGLDFCSALLGDFIKSEPPLSSANERSDSVLARFQRQGSTPMIRIDATANRSDTTEALFDIGRKLEAIEITKGNTNRKRDISELMDMFTD